jgi:hypothetical protein
VILVKLRLFAVFVFACAALPCAAQTLADELRKAGIPDSAFNHDELAQVVNATSARREDMTYFAYMRLDANNQFVGLPLVVSYDPKTAKPQRAELQTSDQDQCCGSPLRIDFTRSFVLISFHDTPSATTVLAVDLQLHQVGILYGFNLHEVAPDIIVYTANMIHFAPVHPERLRVADLRSGKSELLYPPKDDPMRAAFAEVNEKQLPPPETCEKENLPCDPDMFDETVQFLSSKGDGRFELRVTRTAWQPSADTNAIRQVPLQRAFYVYRRAIKGWRYCEREAPISNLISSIPHARDEANTNSCEPTIPVVPDPAASKLDPFPAVVRKMN